MSELNWPEGEYQGTPVRVEMRGGGFICFDVLGHIKRVRLGRRGFALHHPTALMCKYVRGREVWTVVR